MSKSHTTRQLMTLEAPWCHKHWAYIQTKGDSKIGEMARLMILETALESKDFLQLVPEGFGKASTKRINAALIKLAPVCCRFWDDSYARAFDKSTFSLSTKPFIEKSTPQKSVSIEDTVLCEFHFRQIKSKVSFPELPRFTSRLVSELMSRPDFKTALLMNGGTQDKVPTTVMEFRPVCCSVGQVVLDMMLDEYKMKEAVDEKAEIQAGTESDGEVAILRSA